MKIYTKTGDEGTTSLVGGERVPKNSARVNAYGDVDELVSWLGVLRADVKSAFKAPGDGSGEAIEVTLRRIQADLMVVSSHLASGRSIDKLPILSPAETAFLESQIDALSARIPQQDTFILPSAPISSSHCHVARTVCRRAERSAVAISPKTAQDQAGIIFLNRLSDFLFTLARFLCVSCGTPEDKWVPGK